MQICNVPVASSSWLFKAPLICNLETLTWIKSILENSITNSRVALIVVKWDLNCDVLWFLKCYFEKRARSRILLTSFPCENLCSTAIKNVDVAAVGSKSWQCVFFFKKGGRVFERKIIHILLKPTKLNSWYRDCALQKISEIQPVILGRESVVSFNVFSSLRIKKVGSIFAPLIIKVIITSRSLFSPGEVPFPRKRKFLTSQSSSFSSPFPPSYNLPPDYHAICICKFWKCKWN